MHYRLGDMQCGLPIECADKLTDCAVVVFCFRDMFPLWYDIEFDVVVVHDFIG